MIPAWLMLIGVLSVGDPAPAVGPPTEPPAPADPNPAAVLPPVTQNPETPPIPAPIPPPKILSKPAPAPGVTASATKVNLLPVYEAGETVKLKWTAKSEDNREGETLQEQQKQSKSETEIYMTLKVEQVFPDSVYRCSIKVDRIVIEASVFGGRERYDSADPASLGSVFAGPARILLSKPIELGFSGLTYHCYRKEHPRLRVWYRDGINLLDNTFGYEAFPARFGVLFGWLAQSAAVGESWQDQMPIRVNSGFAIETLRTTTLLSDDGVTMTIGIKGVGQSAPNAGQKGLQFEKSAYDATYTVNSASARIRRGEVTHTYTCTYMWKNAPAKVTSTVRETLERLE